MKQGFTLSAIILLILSTTAVLVYYSLVSENKETTQFYVGVTFCGNTTAEAKLLIDRVKNYTNLFVLQSGSLQQNQTAINEIGDYAVASGLNYLVYFGTNNLLFDASWFDTAKQRWGDHFLGVYNGDEPAGKRLDSSTYLVPREDDTSGFSILGSDRTISITEPDGTMSTLRPNGTIFIVKPDDPIRMIERDGTIHIVEPSGNVSIVEADSYSYDYSAYIPQNYDEAAEGFVNVLQHTVQGLKNQSITTFTSDYALYWFDYLAGYDVVLAHFGWNHTLAQDIALVRGAARLQNKRWGAVITWKYWEPPYLDSGEEIFRQMCMAYEAGAEYIVIFNYAETNPSGIMADEHFEALERFWNDVVTNPEIVHGSIKAEAVLVLPKDYGWGMRHPEDDIWGLWGPDEKSPQIWEFSRNLLAQYGLGLDIVYDDPAFPVAGKYPQIYYWNHTS